MILQETFWITLYLVFRKDNIVKEINSSISDYTYEDFVAEFETDVTGEDMFDEDIRIEAEHELLDGGTFTAGRVPDRQYLVVYSFSSCRIIIS